MLFVRLDLIVDTPERIREQARDLVAGGAANGKL
jgi:hypothetical protein